MDGPLRSTKDAQMLWLFIFVAALMLTCIATTSGNAQVNGKKSPIKLIPRNSSSSKDASSAKPSSPTGRAPTAIDPLSHVCLPASHIRRSNHELYSVFMFEEYQKTSFADFLEQHILKRTNTENTIPPKLRNVGTMDTTTAEVGSPVSPEIGPPGRQLTTPEVSRSDSNPIKEKK